MTWVIAVACLCQMPLVLKMATLQQGSRCILQLAKKESITAVKHAFVHNFTWKYPAKYPCMLGTRNSSRKGAFAKERVLVSLLCIKELWTMSGLASNAANKNQRA
jgi:hypothetical protein